MSHIYHSLEISCSQEHSGYYGIGCQGIELFPHSEINNSYFNWRGKDRKSGKYTQIIKTAILYNKQTKSFGEIKKELKNWKRKVKVRTGGTYICIIENAIFRKAEKKKLNKYIFIQ